VLFALITELPGAGDHVSVLSNSTLSSQDTYNVTVAAT